MQANDTTTTEITRTFALPGEVLDIRPHVGGHINRSWVISTRDGDKVRRYFLQQINTAVFRDVAVLMNNIAAVTAHLHTELERRGLSDIHRRVLRPLRTIDAALYWRDADGRCWRMFDYIDGTASRQALQTPRDANELGVAFGEFQELLSTYTGLPLTEVIPGFHDTPARLRMFDAALSRDACNRAGQAVPEIAVVDKFRVLAPLLLEIAASGRAPLRIVHNDAKLSNVLFDAATGERLCVVDLDIVMPGLSLFDFGDMLRSATTFADEDERDLTRVNFEIELFTALAQGYMRAARGFLTEVEREHLVAAGMVITFEQAIRFLGDYLQGDRYYPASRADHNLHRARTQLALLEQFAQRRGEMEQVIARLQTD